MTEWQSDGTATHSWITYRFARAERVNEVVLKLSGWRSKCYPLAVYAGKRKVWEGVTPASLGYVHLSIAKPVKTKELTLRMVGPVVDSSAFGQVTELAGGAANAMDRLKSDNARTDLRIVEAEFHVAE